MSNEYIRCLKRLIRPLFKVKLKSLKNTMMTYR